MRDYIKRIFDIFLSLTLLVFLSPIFVVVYLFVKLKLGTPAIFKQDRPGKDAKIFTMYKFRTMTDEKDTEGHLLPDEKRLTEFGLFLRKSSLDELPEFFNILKGDMSFVGPRPLLVQYLTRYNEEQMRRHEVKPGLTGWAQVNGRNAISWEEKFRLDVWYVDHKNLMLDLKIILMTIAKVFNREGISQEGQATMEEFMGGRRIEGQKVRGLEGQEDRRLEGQKVRGAEGQEDRRSER